MCISWTIKGLKFTGVPVVTIFGSIPITLQRCFALWFFFFNLSHSYNHPCSRAAFCLHIVFRLLVTVKLIFVPSSKSKTGEAVRNWHHSALWTHGPYWKHSTIQSDTGEKAKILGHCKKNVHTIMSLILNGCLVSAIWISRRNYVRYFLCVVGLRKVAAWDELLACILDAAAAIKT